MSQDIFPEHPVLIVDDQKEFLDAFEYYLQSNGITNVDLCQENQKVLLLLKEKKYSLILLDLHFDEGGIQGEQLLEQIHLDYPETPVMILTGYADVPKAVECVKKGAIDILEKTLAPDVLIKKIRDTLSLDSYGELVKDELGDEERGFLDQIDIPTLAYHLVLSRNAPPELLDHVDRNKMQKAIEKMAPQINDVHGEITNLKKLEEKYEGRIPNPLWCSWFSETQKKNIKEVKEMFGGNN